MERVGGGGGWKSNVEMIYPTCPRCGSSNTKFCYYNNYSLTQPRYFCKGCRRYWTKGGSLRNIPVGGGCRKTRRERKSSSRTSTPTTTTAHGVSSSTLLQPPPRTTNMNIDLAQVYANFLNPQQQQQPEPETNDQVQGLIIFPGSSTDHQQLVLQATSFGPFMSTDVDTDDHEFAVSYINNHGTLHGICGFNSLSKQRDCLFGLPPLPGEEMGWSDHQNGGIILDVHPVTSADGVLSQVLPPNSIQTGQVLDPNHLFESGDAFDNYETLFRP